MLAHFRKLLDQLLQTLSDRYALHRDGALSSGVAAEWCWDMDFHCYLLCRTCLFDARKSVSMRRTGRAAGQGGPGTCGSADVEKSPPEVTSRSGRVIAIATEGDQHIHLLKKSGNGSEIAHVLEIPAAPELLLPILEVVPLQLLAYHIAVRRGCDVDQPRNLAKSVTVEQPQQTWRLFYAEAP